MAAIGNHREGLEFLRWMKTGAGRGTKMIQTGSLHGVQYIQCAACRICKSLRRGAYDAAGNMDSGIICISFMACA